MGQLEVRIRFCEGDLSTDTIFSSQVNAVSIEKEKGSIIWNYCFMFFSISDQQEVREGRGKC